jgi:hypothetical protein
MKAEQNAIAAVIVGVIVAAVAGAVGVLVITNTVSAAGITGGLWPIIYLLIPALVIMALVGAFIYVTR